MINIPKRPLISLGSSVLRRCFFSTNPSPNFGILFDIDGVLMRGTNVLPYAPKAFEKLVYQTESGRREFRVPTVFVTNAGNCLRKSKAEQLSKWLDVEVHEDQVVMAHSPLRMFSDYHDKHILVSGQGPILDIAANLGFTRVTTMERLRHAFPTLDAVDHKRRRAAPCSFEGYFPPIDAVVLFGEPIRWETSLQLIIDVLVTDGHPSEPPARFPYPHLPILACNMDLQFMAEAVIPRFGHGAFLVCLEHLYQKITGHDLIYTALIGKPSELTYRHADHCLQKEARRIGLSDPIDNIYCVGDNICTDIYGANLYNRYLNTGNKNTAMSNSSGSSRSIERLIGNRNDDDFIEASNCFSVLVETGVYSTHAKSAVSLNHSPRDFLPIDDSYQEPTFVVPNVLEAVNLIFRREEFE